MSIEVTENLTDLVNVKQGTKNTRRFSNGNALPLVGMPHGMATFCLQTDHADTPWFYNPERNFYEGIRLTHQPSPWVGDFGHILFMPQSGNEDSNINTAWSSVRNKDIVLKPHYLKVESLRYRTVFELTPTLRGAAIRIKYNKKDINRLSIIPFDYDGQMHLDVAAKKLYGYTKAFSHSAHEDYAMYFELNFDSEIDLENTNKLSAVGKGAPISIAFKSDTVLAKLAISFISLEQAHQNYLAELKGKSFESIFDNALASWEDKLSRIQVSNENKERTKTFYTCLWRTFLYPTTLYEIDKSGKEIHICPDNCKVSEGAYYTNNGFWDTFRTVYPLYAIIAKKEYAKMCEGYINYYKDTGWLPKWLSPGEFGIMPGTLIEAVLADAIVQDIISGELAKTALEAMLKQANNPSGNNKQGRTGCGEYLRLDYIPYDKYNESVNHTLDCVYGDYCIARAAEKLGQKDTAKEFYVRSKNYAKLFDKQSGFIRAKDSSGNFRPDFDSYDWGRDYCEGSAWQNSFAVYHDIEGLAKLYGGKHKLLEKIDELFAAPPIFNVGGYGFEIHEMSEMATADFGQCAISNQPSFHIPYIYSMLGDSKKTANIVKAIADKAFSYKEDGFPGDEDNGTTAAWYIFACLGYYPFCPASGKYAMSKPLFNKITIKDKPE